MLLDSVLAELSTDDDLSDRCQKMLHVKTDSATGQESYSHVTSSKAPQNYSFRTHKIVLEMYSPQESSCELLRNSGKLMNHMTHLSEEYYSYKAPPDCVPVRWPGVRKAVRREEEVRDDNARRASSAILPSSHSIRTSSASLIESETYFSWNLSHLHRKSIDVFEGSLQGKNISDYDGEDYEYEYEDEDIIAPNIELDAQKADWVDKSDHEATNLAAGEDHSSNNSNFELTPMPSSPARTARASLQWRVFPGCLGKCSVPPPVKRKEKSTRTVPTTLQEVKDSKVGFASHGLKMRFACQPLGGRAKKTNGKQF